MARVDFKHESVRQKIDYTKAKPKSLREKPGFCARHTPYVVGIWSFPSCFISFQFPYLGIKCKCLFSKFRENPVTTEKLSPRPVEWTSTECSLLIISSLVRIHINCTMIKRHPLTSTYHFLSQVVIGSIFFYYVYDEPIQRPEPNTIF